MRLSALLNKAVWRCPKSCLFILPPTLFSMFVFKKAHWETTNFTQRNEYLIGRLSDPWKEGEGDPLWCQVLPANPVEATVFDCLSWALYNYMWHPWITTWRNVFSGRKFAELWFYMHSEQNVHCKISQIAPEFPFLLLHEAKSLVLFKDQLNCWCLWSSPWRPTPFPLPTPLLSWCFWSDLFA